MQEANTMYNYVTTNKVLVTQPLYIDLHRPMSTCVFSDYKYGWSWGLAILTAILQVIAVILIWAAARVVVVN